MKFDKYNKEQEKSLGVYYPGDTSLGGPDFHNDTVSEDLHEPWAIQKEKYSLWHQFFIVFTFLPF